MKPAHLTCFVAVCALILTLTGMPTAFAADAISLEGLCRFRLDPDKVGVDQQWYKSTLLERIRVPGSTDEAGYGTLNDKTDLERLSRQFIYTGPVWYQWDVDIPESWQGKRITLFLERCHWETQAWLDDKPVGMQDSLCVPHVHELSKYATPGKHVLTVRVDNTIKYDVGIHAHSITKETQTNWNGIIGAIELRASDPVYIAGVQVYPDPKAGTARVHVTVGNELGRPAEGQISLSVSSRGIPQMSNVEAAVKLDGASAEVEVQLPMGKHSRQWDEFSPILYRLTSSLAAKSGNDSFKDSVQTTFGMRQISTQDHRILLNGRNIFLRGTLECCIFPKTGYPPMDVQAWTRIFDIAQSYGLNHLRFHSWCPPEAAFVAADEMGFLLHVEAPEWVHNIGKDAPRDDFIHKEVQRILDAYGNHPSFGMLCLGNELKGDEALLDRLVQFAEQRDPRHLYASTTAYFCNPSDTYAIPYKCRGLHGDSTDKDFREIVATYRVPCITHELGQWTVFPNMAEIAKYTGVLRARNFQMVRDDLAAKDLLEQAPQFTLATGKQMLELYKEEIESQLRTPNCSGFQLLDLHDFPGQGTALVGTLDAFWDSKGLIEPAAFRRYCGPTVPLLRLSKRIFESGEKLSADVEVAHFGPADLPNAAFAWSIREEGGSQIASGALPMKSAPTGERTALGKIEATLNVKHAAKLIVTVALPGTQIGNDWEIWVYPAGKPVDAPKGILVTGAWNEAARAALDAGGKVLLLPKRGCITRSLKGSFLPPFWSPIWFAKNAQSMSILCDPANPALADFPTEMYSNWQWRDLLDTSRSMILDDAPADFRPIVQVVDNFTRNHRLANLFEAAVGRGRLVVCSLDLRTDLEHRPVARQMWNDLIAYMTSERFAPSQTLSAEWLSKMFPQYVPAEVTRDLPGNLGEVMLRVKAAAKAKRGNGRWSKAVDGIEVQQTGFDYAVSNSGVWKDDAGTSWVSSSRCAVSITCPKGFAGKLYVRLDDWNNLNRKADVLLNDRLVADLNEYNHGGRWVHIPLAAADTPDGSIQIDATSTGKINVMITDVIVCR